MMDDEGNAEGKADTSPINLQNSAVCACLHGNTSSPLLTGPPTYYQSVDEGVCLLKMWRALLIPSPLKLPLPSGGCNILPIKPLNCHTYAL